MNVTSDKLTKQEQGWKSGGPPTALRTEGKLITDPQEIATTQMNF